MPTLEVTNLGGGLTRRINGDINSGLAKYNTSWGYDPYSKPGNLTWMEQPVSILTLSGSAGPIVAMKNRPVGTGDNRNYVYAIAENANLYEIKVSATAQNPNLDSPSIVGALPITPNFTRSADMIFYGSTEKIFISGDNVIQRINFNGSGAASITGTPSSVLTTTPHPMTTFLGKIYFGNGNNIGEIDSTELITSGAKLSPGLPAGTYVKDLDITPDGNYLQITASRNDFSGEQSGDSADLGSPSAGESYKFYWNGTDAGATSSETYSGQALVSNTVFGDKNYTFGYDSNGAAIFQGSKKIVSLPRANAPFPTAVFSVSNMLGFAMGEYDNSDNRFKGVLYNYGQFDEETSSGLFRILKQTPSGSTEHILTIPACINVSNLVYAPSIFGWPNYTAGVAKLYYSTVQGSVSGTANYEQRLWKFTTAPIGTASVVAGVYETQTQMFSKKITVNEVRVYTDPLIGGNDFIIDLIGSGGSVLSGGSQNFTVGTNVTALDDRVRFNPTIAPTYVLGIRVTNASITGVANWTANKIEVDYSEAGK